MAPASLQLQEEEQDKKETEISTSASEQQKIEAEHVVVPRELREKEAEIIVVPAASQQEIAPAAPAEQRNEEKEAEVEPLVRWNKIVLPPPDSQEKAAAVEIRKEVLSLLYFLRGTNSEIMQPVGHLATDDCEREALNFIDMELSIIEASMMLRRPSPREYQFYEHKMMCLDESKRLVLHIHGLLASYHHHVDTRRHTLLHKAVQCLLDPCRYQKLLFSSQEHGLPVPPDMTKAAGGHRLVGIDRPTEKMLRWLTAAAKDLRILSIVGSAGMGKTALAMNIYHQLQCSFQFSCACNISRRPDRNELLLQDILSQISGLSSSDQSQIATLEQLVQRVSECLRDKRYFILIDDLWESSDWQKIEGAFPKNGSDSRILITTRVRGTAWSCCSYSEGIVHEMRPLNGIDSETLLVTAAFGSVNNGCSSPSGNLKLLCDKILRTCQGTPLFITGMANWLKDQQQQSSYNWYNLIEKIPRVLRSFEQVISSTYNDLPHELKLLSLYMSMFPLGYMFEKDRLVTKWESEGLSHADGLVSPYFSQLVDRNFITPVLLPGQCIHNPPEGDEAACQWQVNDFILQFLASKSGEKGLVYTIDTLSSPEGSGRKSIIPRRLALHHPDPMLPSKLERLERLDLSETRSLAVSGAVDVIPLDKFVYLVVLDLEGWNNLNDETMLQICGSKMFLLTYLSIRNTPVSNLPHQIKELSRLRILDASGTQISKLPPEVCELEYLYKLDLRGTQIRELLPNEIVWPHSLQHLLVGGEGMINTVDAETATTIPEDICRVRALKTLATVDLRKSPASFLNALGDQQQLKVLAITWLFDQCNNNGIVYHEEFLSSIKKWRLLESLSLHCGLGCSMEFLESLNDPPLQLREFKVTAARFVGVPKWIEKTKDLSFVQIIVCRLPTADMKILENLPKLKCLILGLEFIPREAIVIGNEGFTELLKFSVDCPMPWLTFTAGAMRKLTSLQLKVCSGPGNEDSVPSGICNLLRLSEVVLTYNKVWSWCADSSSVNTVVNVVKKEVAKHPNPVNLIINGTIHDVEVAEKTQKANEIQREIKAGDEKQSQISCPEHATDDWEHRRSRSPSGRGREQFTSSVSPDPLADFYRVQAPPEGLRFHEEDPMVQESSGTWTTAAAHLRYSPDSGGETQGSPVYEPVLALWTSAQQAQRMEALHELRFGPGVQLDELDEYAVHDNAAAHHATAFGPEILHHDSARSADWGQVDDISDRVTRMYIDTAAAYGSTVAIGGSVSGDGPPAGHDLYDDYDASQAGDGRSFCKTIFTPVPEPLLPRPASPPP